METKSNRWRVILGSGSVLSVLLLSASAWGQEAPPKSESADTPPAAAAPAAPDAATSEGEEVVNKYPQIKEAIDLLRQFKFDECFKKLEEAEAAHPELPPARLVYSELLIKVNQLAIGRAEMEKVAVERPDDPRIPLSMAAVGLAEGRNADSLLQVNRALDLAQNFDFKDPDLKSKFLAKAYLARATVAERREDWKGVKEDVLKWLEVEPKSGPVRQRLAQAVFFLGDVEGAEAELRQAKGDVPGLAPPETTLASFYSKQKEMEKAEELFRKGIEADPNNPQGYHAFAQWLFQRGRAREAREQAVKGLETLPDSKDLRVLRAVLARYLKSYEEAEAELDDLLRETPNNLALRNELALALAEQQDGNKQKRAFQMAAENFQAQRNNTDYIATLGWVNYRLGRMEDAERLITAAARMAGNNARPDLLYYLAHIFAEKGNNEDVKKLLTQITASEVPFAFKDDASQWLERLNSSSP